MTPEILEKSLKELLTICARRTGMERILAIRRTIHKINYSKKTISVELFYPRPPDGKSLLNQRPSFAAPRAAAKPLTPAPNRKEPNRFRQLGSSGFSENAKNGGNFPSNPRFIVSFPNIAHNYWENYHRTGEFYVHLAKAPRL